MALLRHDTRKSLFAGAASGVLELAGQDVTMLHSLSDVQVISQKTRLVCGAQVRFAGCPAQGWRPGQEATEPVLSAHKGPPWIAPTPARHPTAGRGRHPRHRRSADWLPVDVWTTNEHLQRYDLRQGLTYVGTVLLPPNPPERCSNGQPSGS